MTETVSDSASERCVRCPYSQSSTAEVLVVACPSDQPSQLGHCPLIYTPDTVLLPRALSLKGLLRDPRGAGKEILIFVPHSWRRRLMRRGMSNCHGGSLCHPLLNWTSSITATNAGQMFWQVTNCFPAQPRSLPTFFSLWVNFCLHRCFQSNRNALFMVHWWDGEFALRHIFYPWISRFSCMWAENSMMLSDWSPCSQFMNNKDCQSHISWDFQHTVRQQIAAVIWYVMALCWSSATGYTPHPRAGIRDGDGWFSPSSMATIGSAGTFLWYLGKGKQNWICWGQKGWSKHQFIGGAFSLCSEGLAVTLSGL